MNNEELLLSKIFRDWSGEEPLDISSLPGSGSYRKYYRLKGGAGNIIGVFNEDIKENLAFMSFTKSFHDAGFPVPDIFYADPGKKAYLMKDLGDTTLFHMIDEERQAGAGFSAKSETIYREAVRWLAQFQVEGALLVDFRHCYPRAAFDSQSMMWDLNYFKYYFLKLAKVPFDEQKLEDDFVAFTGFLLKAESGFFMYRDFQSRNIMILDGRPWFIDYQGGRKGPLQYDIASLLYDAKAAIPGDVRSRLLDHYLEELGTKIRVDTETFRSFYHGFVLIRILQALGAYGFRGYYENKPHFLKSIPFAMDNLRSLLDRGALPAGLPALEAILEKMAGNPDFSHPAGMQANLTVSICSFSFKNSPPADESGNGGGFVFDCRALPNPGKIDEFRALSGLDQPVREFLRKEPSVDEFLNHASAIVGQSVKKYIERDFSSLMVCFGCTGGQHRSVYCAEELAKHIREKFPVNVKVFHAGLEDRK